MPKPLVISETTLGTAGRATFGGFTAMGGLLEIDATSPIAGGLSPVLVAFAP